MAVCFAAQDHEPKGPRAGVAGTSPTSLMIEMHFCAQRPKTVAHFYMHVTHCADLDEDAEVGKGGGHLVLQQPVQFTCLCACIPHL